LPAIAQTLEHFTKLPKHAYTRPEEAGVTSLLNSICNFDFVVTIVIVQMCLALQEAVRGNYENLSNDAKGEDEQSGS
jgi:hypothetical protein